MKLSLFLLSFCMSLHIGARAQSNSSKPIQLIIPASAGTTGDQIARILAPKLSQRMNVPVYVENKVGAGGSIAFEYVARSKPDGHTFVMTTTAC